MQMTTRKMGLHKFLSVIFATGAAAQGVRPSCERTAEVKALGIEDVQTRLNAGADDFFLYQRLEDLTPGTLAPIFEGKLRDRQDDPSYLYLYGRSLIGKNTPQAIVQLNRAVQLAPDFPWTYTALARVYNSRNFGNRAKALESIRAYRKLCPTNIDGFAYLTIDNDPAEAAEWAKELRSLLERSTEPNSGYWSPLWAFEFSHTAKTEYDSLRRRVGVDIKRLEAAPEPWSRSLLNDLVSASHSDVVRSMATPQQNLIGPRLAN